jgi:hypothetical protein
LAKSYRVQLVCHHLNHTHWVLMEGLHLSLERVLDTLWEFDCPIHGSQRGKPLQAEERKEFWPENPICSVHDCANRFIGAVGMRAFCRNHFIRICEEQLETYIQRLNEQRWRDLSLGAVEEFIYFCMRAADQIEQGENELDDSERAKLLKIISLAAELGSYLRRSPRMPLRIPFRLISEKPHDSWEEETATILVSRYGCLIHSQHSAKLDQRLLVVRNEGGRRAQARVAWSPGARDLQSTLAIEFLDQDNFWGLDWKSPKMGV